MTQVHDQESTSAIHGSREGPHQTAKGHAPDDGDFLSHLGQAVRENPASAALISMGVVWLFMGGSRVSLFGDLERGRLDRDRRAPVYPVPYDPHTDEGVDSTLQAGSYAGDGIRRAGAMASRSASAVGERASEALSVTYDGLEEAGHRTSDALSRVGSSAYQASRTVSHATTRVTGALHESLSELFDRQPLAMGAVGLAIGAGLAAALPRTKVESRVMGEASDAVKEQAQDLISSQLHDASKLADWALRTITQEAKAQGLSSSAIADLVRGFAEKVTSAASAGGRGGEHSAAGQGPDQSN